MSNDYRSHYCGLITENDIDKTITVSGWVENIRDHGGVIFIDVRDEKGIIQVVSNDDSIFSDLTKESTVTITGIVRKRAKEDYNDNIATGTLELFIQDLKIISKSLPLPFDIKSSTSVNEEIRLKYRYLDLRNQKNHDKLKFRSEVLKFLRNKMDHLGFIEVQTPIISVSSPEGARDFVIPSRKFPGKFYALPQAPQIYKQLLMVSGFDKYYQIAPCFRDEDGRSDRTLEFYQLDFEMSFAKEEDIYSIGEEIFYDTFLNFSNKKVSPLPFKRIDYEESMLKYGTDKPDLRNPLEIVDLSNLFKNTEFKPFQKAFVRGIKVDNIGSYPNSWFNELVEYATSIGMPGIGYITLLDDKKLKGPIDKFLTDEDRSLLIEKLDLKVNSVLFFIAHKKESFVNNFAGLIRTELGHKLDLIDTNSYQFCIIHNFPMYEYDEEEGTYDFGHNPFSMPQCKIEDLKKENRKNIKAYQYDFVCNGYEMASGAVRNHDIHIMEKVFELVGYDKEFVEEKFKALYKAFQYGAPPHAGMAPGIDRILMLLLDEPNLREVQAFPSNVSGQDNMMGSPSGLDEKQLRELHIKIR